MAPITLTDLPPELLDQITTHLPTARSLQSLGTTNKSLHAFVEKDAWQSFARTRFPSLYPCTPPKEASGHREVARTLATLSRAWDRRAFVARHIEPHGSIRAFPGDRNVERWKRPRGQTIGFTPQLDCFEEVGSSWRERKETLAFSAGAEICVRQRHIGNDGGEDVRWMTYKPPDALEGQDDVTSLHLLQPQNGSREGRAWVELITGTANGDLQLLSLPNEQGAEIPQTYFTTQGLPVRSTSVHQEPWKPALLAANMGETRVSLYHVVSNNSSIAPTSSIDIERPQNGRTTYRAWSTNFLSSNHLAVGLGPSEEPIHIYTITPSGLEKNALRKYSLQNDIDRLQGNITLSGFAKKSTSSVYPVVPLPPGSTSASGSSEGQIFLSGAYDGIIRLHDMRSNGEVEKAYIDPTDDSSIYSLLPRGRETLVAGTSRHSLLKVFDLRLGAKAYSYLDVSVIGQADCPRQWKSPGTKDWSLFLKPHSATYPGRGGGNNWARRSAESSIYSLASPSPSSPFVYAGVENAVLELAFTSILDPHPDPVFFPTSTSTNNNQGTQAMVGYRAKEILDLAMYDQSQDMKLMTQRSLWETVRLTNHVANNMVQGRMDGILWVRGLDERWKVGSG